MRNVRLAFRTLARTPFVSLVAILSLALGIGANSAIFSMFDQILMQPLPVPAPHELVNLSAPGPKPGSTQCNQAGTCEETFSYPMFRDLERVQDSFVGIAAHRIINTNLSYNGQTESARGVLVSGSYFPTLGLTPAAGRLFTPEDDKTPGTQLSGGHQSRLLAPALPGRSRGGRAVADRQRSCLHDHRRQPGGLRGHDARRPARSVFVPITMRGQMLTGTQGPGSRTAGSTGPICSAASSRG